MKILKPNRNKTQEPKTGKGWCFNCDRAIVANGEKCPVCGKREGKRRNKKPAVPFFDE